MKTDEEGLYMAFYAVASNDQLPAIPKYQDEKIYALTEKEAVQKAKIKAAIIDLFKRLKGEISKNEEVKLLSVRRQTDKRIIYACGHLTDCD